MSYKNTICFYVFVLLIGLFSCTTKREFSFVYGLPQNRIEQRFLMQMQLLEKKIKKKEKVLEFKQKELYAKQKEYFQLEMDLISHRYEQFYREFSLFPPYSEETKWFIAHLPEDLFSQERKRLSHILSLDESLKEQAQSLLDKILRFITEMNNLKSKDL